MMYSALFALLPLLPACLAAPYVKRDTGVLIYSGRDGKCLSTPMGVQLENGTPVNSVDCSFASRWDINRGSGSVVLTGTNYALDIGLNPTNNGALKVWQSYPTAPQQTWYYTDDNRIAQTGGTQCLDEGTNGIQTYQCTTGNTNQIFYTRQAVGPSSSVPPPPSSSSAPASSSSAPPPPSGGNRIQAAAYNNQCLTTRDNSNYNGNPVQIANCDGSIKGQTWQLPAVGQTGPITNGNGGCLDAGDNPANGSGVKVWQCYPGLIQQTWTRNADGTFSLSNGQALDVEKEDNKSVQTWLRSNNGDPQQKFNVA